MRKLHGYPTRASVLVVVSCFSILWSAQSLATDCAPHDIELSSQTDVDDFQANHGPCDRVVGLLTIDGADIENVDGLSALTSIGDGLRFLFTSSLGDISGLSSLTSIDGYLFFSDCESLTQIDGLSNLLTVGSSVQFSFNDALVNLNGLSTLTSVGSLILEFNTELMDLDGLSSLADVELNVHLESNTALTSLQGLASLTSVGGSLTVKDIGGLVDLEGLQNITSLGGDLLLRYNPGLLSVDLLSLTTVNGNVSIQNNGGLTQLDGLSSLIGVGENLLVSENPGLNECTALTSLLDDVDDGEPGPGPGLDGIPDVGNQATFIDNREGCNSITEIMTIFGDGFESGPNTITSLDATPATGIHTFLAIGSDGYPIVSFGDQFAGSLRLVLCDGIKCDNTHPTITTIDQQETWVGTQSSIAIGQDGYPVIAYSGNISTWSPLLIGKCNDIRCMGGDEQISIADNPEFHVGFSSSIAIGADEFPVISHISELEGVVSLRVTKCNDVACAGENESSVIIQEGLGPSDTSLAIGTDGFPIIATMDANLNHLLFVKCDDSACSGEGEIVTILADDVGTNHISMKLGTDGFPIIAYQGNFGPTLKVIKCNDSACAGNDETESVVDDAGEDPGAPVSIAIGDDGNPIIAYWDRVGALGQLVVASCNDIACSGGDETITVVDGPSHVGQGISLAIGSDGLPIMSYLDAEIWPGSIKVLHCSVPDCNP